MVEKKGEIRVFVDGLYLRIIDDLIAAGYGTNRSEVVRKIIDMWVMETLPRVRELLDYAKRSK